MDSTIKVVIQNIEGVLEEIDVVQSGTIRHIKEKYSELHTDIAVEQQKLCIPQSIDGQVSRILLQDNRTLSSCNISPDGVGSHGNPLLLFVCAPNVGMRGRV